MAKITTLTPQPRPTPQVERGIARYRTPDTASTVQQGMLALGSSIEEAAREIHRAQKIEEERINTLRAEEAFNTLRTTQLELTAGEGGYQTLRGSQTVGKPILKDYTEKFEDSVRTITQELTNDRQRALFKNRAGVARAQYQEGILRHLAKEGDTYADEIFKGTVATELQHAATRWDSPNDVALSATRIEASVNARAEQAGWPAEYRDAMLSEKLGRLHADVIGQAIANGDHLYAKAWFDKHEKDVDPASAKALAKAVENAAQKQLTDGYNRDFLASQQNPKALRELEARVVGDKVLDDARKNILHGRILGRIDRLEAKAERERAQHLRVLGKAIDEANANTLAGMPSKPEQLLPIVEAAAGTEMEAEARQMVMLANATGRFSVLSPIAQANEITRLETAVRADPGKFDRRVLEAYKQIHSSQQQALSKDPVTFAVRQGVSEIGPLDLSQPRLAADALQERFALARSMQAAYGAPMLPLTEPEQKLVSHALDTASWKDRRDYLAQIWQAARGDTAGYSAIMAQIAPDHPVTAMAGEFAAKGRNQASDMMLQGEAIMRPSTKADGTPTGGGLVPMPPEGDMRSRFDDTVRDAYAGRPNLSNTVYQATKSIYAKLAADQGLKDTKAIDPELWEQATLLATGGIYEHNGRYLPMPYGMDGGTFEDQVRRRTEHMERQNQLPPGITAAMLQGLQLEPVGDNRYAFRTGNGILVAPQQQGKPPAPLILDFSQSAPFRVSGSEDAQPPSLEQQWLNATGGKLLPGENRARAIERWATTETGAKRGRINPAKVPPSSPPEPVRTPGSGTTTPRG